MINKNHAYYKEISQEDWDNILIDYTVNKLSLTKIVNKYKQPGLYSKKITEYLNSKGIEVINNQNERGTNNNIFSKINTEGKAYWLGLLYADGYVSKSDNKIELSLHLQDLETINNFKKFIGADNKLMFCKKWKLVRYAFGSKQIKKDLIKLGCTPVKSKILKFPTNKQVPKHLISHFIRGYFDGDGCLGKFKSSASTGYYARVSIISTEDFINGIKNFIHNKTEAKLAFASRCDDVYELILANKKAESFLKQIYENSNICMKRKQIRYRIFKKNNFNIKFDKKSDIDLFTKIYNK